MIFDKGGFCLTCLKNATKKEGCENCLEYKTNWKEYILPAKDVMIEDILNKTLYKSGIKQKDMYTYKKFNRKQINLIRSAIIKTTKADIRCEKCGKKIGPAMYYSSEGKCKDCLKKEKKGIREDEMRNGFQDNLEPLAPLDLRNIHSFNGMAKSMSKTAFGGRSLGEAVDVLEAMVKDKDCFVVLTLAGAMTPAKMGLVACDMIDYGMVNAIVSTGALMTHGFVEEQGMVHFKYKFGEMDDRELYYKGYDRIYDIIELEKNLDDTEFIFRDIMNKLNQEEILCSRKILEACSKWLMEHTKGRGILKSAYKKGVPVYIPAFTDCEMGLDFGLYNLRRERLGQKVIEFNPFLDLNHFVNLIKKQKEIGIFTIGGGVPRNWTQQVAPYLDIIQKRLENQCPACQGKGCKKCNKRGFLKDTGGEPLVRYKYGVRICPEPVHFGGLSGCTFSEGVSWGKFMPKSEGGRWAEVLADATIAWPLIVKAAMERMNKNNKYKY